MYNKPDDAPTDYINAMSQAEEAGLKNFASAMDKVAALVNPEVVMHDRSPLRDGDTHEVAAYLYRKFRPGSAILSKTDAYRIGNLIEAQQRQLDEANATVQRLLKEIAALAVEPPTDDELADKPRTSRVIYSSGRREEPDDITDSHDNSLEIEENVNEEKQ